MPAELGKTLPIAKDITAASQITSELNKLFNEISRQPDDPEIIHKLAYITNITSVLEGKIPITLIGIQNGIGNFNHEIPTVKAAVWQMIKSELSIYPHALLDSDLVPFTNIYWRTSLPDIMIYQNIIYDEQNKAIQQKWVLINTKKYKSSDYPDEAIRKRNGVILKR
ncbi:MAG: hypothetical protein UR52_C0015G0014 [Candidatus Gottesmanbacteria bacterium GW2011_GWA1_34_13]|uniref:Uncharacterized protein n=1 Tax=Candidatus Gottesmanbacteria bacterium GW2011_GWA1_34_13 TaxID=1618434 RepID=A0A0G0APS2_9BACT|nr:MAG: hypothetical protein UR52_C0015G0014 [Candidatus Gottesmanbacteria bacterium GW2011_GWA1_34_13]